MISAIIITLNEEKRIRRCIESLQQVVDEIIVMDSGSEDDTQQVAASLGATVFQTDWLGYAATKNLANTKAKYPYILSLDADEVLSPALQASILSHKKELNGAYQFARLTSYCGSWIHHGGWYPDKKVRLFPKEQAKWEGDFVHEKLILATGTTTYTLAGDLLHYSIDSVADHWQRLATYSPLKAQALFEQGRNIPSWQIHLRVSWKFVKMYMFKQGFRDGKAGWQLARLSAAGELLKWLHLRELHQQRDHKDPI